jgi:hypothetical protein
LGVVNIGFPALTTPAVWVEPMSARDDKAEAYSGDADHQSDDHDFQMCRAIGSGHRVAMEQQRPSIKLLNKEFDRFWIDVASPFRFDLVRCLTIIAAWSRNFQKNGGVRGRRPA